MPDTATSGSEALAGRSTPGPRTIAYYPEYGTVQGLVGAAFYVLVIDLATPAVVEASTGVLPDVAPSTVTTGLAASLWLVVGLTLLTEARRQLDPNPRWFADRAALRAFLAAGRPSRTRLGYAAVMLVLGAALLGATWADLGEALASVVRSLPDVAAVALGDDAVLTLVAFLVGSAMLGYGLDRLAVGGLRLLLAAGAEAPPAARQG